MILWLLNLDTELHRLRDVVPRPLIRWRLSQLIRVADAEKLRVQKNLLNFKLSVSARSPSSFGAAFLSLLLQICTAHMQGTIMCV